MAQTAGAAPYPGGGGSASVMVGVPIAPAGGRVAGHRRSGSTATPAPVISPSDVPVPNIFVTQEAQEHASTLSSKQSFSSFTDDKLLFRT